MCRKIELERNRKVGKQQGVLLTLEFAPLFCKVILNSTLQRASLRASAVEPREAGAVVARWASTLPHSDTPTFWERELGLCQRARASCVPLSQESQWFRKGLLYFGISNR